jgi:hypothetical protein
MTEKEKRGNEGEKKREREEEGLNCKKERKKEGDPSPGHAGKIARNDRRTQLLDLNQQQQAPNSV